MKSKRITIAEAIRNVGVVLIRLNKTEPCTGFVGETRLIIEVKGRRNNWITIINTRPVEPVVATLVTLTTNSPNEFEYGMIEVQLHSYLRVGGLHVESLVLCDQNFVVCSCETVTFNIIKVDVSGFKAGRQIIGSKAARGRAILYLNVLSRNNNALFKTFEFNVNLDAVELQRR